MPKPSLPIRDIIQWDVRTWSRALRFWQGYLDERKPRLALAIGERGGGISLWLALQGIDVVCTDLYFPKDTRMLHERYGVTCRITYGRQDATALTFPDASFDLVIFKSVIGALGTKGRQAQAMGEMRRVLKPGGTLLFAENLCATKLHVLLRRRFVRWEHEWRYLHLPEDLDLFAPFARFEWDTTGLLAGFGRSETQRDLLARIDRLACPITPHGWHYILIGACTARASAS